MPWTPADAPKHDKSADTPEKQRRWAKIANAVLKRTGNDVMAIRVASSRIEGVETFLDRVLAEEDAPEEEKKPNLFQRLQRGLENVERATSRSERDRGERPKFTENPWAHLTHRAAEYLEKGRMSSGGPSRSKTGSAPAVTKLIGGGTIGSVSGSARAAHLQVQRDRARALMTRDQQLRYARAGAQRGLRQRRIQAAPVPQVRPGPQPGR